MSKNQSNRQKRAEKLYFELLKRGIVFRNEKEATKLLTASCNRAFENTRPTPRQKIAYTGVSFEFLSPLDMAIYIITEIPDEWNKWKQQTKVYHDSKSNSAKKKTRPTVDRIIRELGYERDNIQILSHSENARKDRQQSLIYLDGNFYGISDTVEDMKNSLYAGYTDLKLLRKQGSIFGYRVLSIKNEAMKKKFFEVKGMTYLTPVELHERDKKMIARNSWIEFNKLF